MNENNNILPEGEASESGTPQKKYKKIDIVAIILCLFIALSIWIFVMNTSQTEVDRTITLTVDVSSQIYEATGMTIFSNLDGTFEGSDMDYSKLRVDLKVSGFKNILDRYEDSDYIINVKTDSIQSGAVQRISFEPVMPSDEISFQSIVTSLPVDSLYIDKQATATISGEKISATLKSGAVSGMTVTMTPNIEELTISGPEKTVNTIAQAQIGVDLLGITTSTKLTSEDIRFLDANGTPIVTTYVKLEPESAEVDVRIDAERSFPISFKQIAATDGTFKYALAITGEVTEIVLKGDTALMPSGNYVIDLVEDITKITSGTIDLKDLKLPEGLELGDGMDKLSVSYIVTKEAMVTDKTDGENS